MKSFLSVLAITAAEAASIIGFGQSSAGLREVTRYQSQEQCDQLPTNRFYRYEFNQEACACFFEFNFEVDFCEGDLVHNPFHRAFRRDLCITPEEYASIFEHGLNDDCTTKSLNFVTYNPLLNPAAAAA